MSGRAVCGSCGRWCGRDRFCIARVKIVQKTLYPKEHWLKNAPVHGLTRLFSATNLSHVKLRYKSHSLEMGHSLATGQPHRTKLFCKTACRCSFWASMEVMARIAHGAAAIPLCGFSGIFSERKCLRN